MMALDIWAGKSKRRRSDHTREIRKCIIKMTGEEIQVIGCGRTDAGVHADNYIANFHTNSDMTVTEIVEYLNQYLPEDL